MPSSEPDAPHLLIISGLPGVGKTSTAEVVATHIDAVHLSVDPVEDAMLAYGLTPGWETGAAAYGAVCAMAEQNLRLGRYVVIDAVNDSDDARQVWRDAADRTGSNLQFVHLVVSDVAHHEGRLRDRDRGLTHVGEPSWSEVQERRKTYAPWTDHVVEIDSVGMTPTEVAHALADKLALNIRN